MWLENVGDGTFVEGVDVDLDGDVPFTSRRPSDVWFGACLVENEGSGALFRPARGAGGR